MTCHAVHTGPTVGCGGCANLEPFAPLLSAGRATRSRPVTENRRARRRSSAEVVIRGDIRTMDPANPRAEAIAVNEGRVVAVGTSHDIANLIDSHTEKHDFTNRVVLPGFVEPHMHYWATALFYDWVDCTIAAGPSQRGARSLDEVLARLKSVAPTSGEWTLGCQFDPSLLPEGHQPNRERLDAVIPDRPVAVLNASMHYLYVNSKALELAGIDESTPDPPGGFFERRDGRLTGAIGEAAAMSEVIKVIPHVDHDRYLDNVVAIARRARAAGVTRTHDAATGAILGVAEVDLLGAAIDRMGSRVSYAIIDSAADQFLARGLSPADGNDLMRARSWKLISDGSNQGRSGFQRDPYLGGSDHGHPNFTQEYAAERIRTAVEAGWQVMVHANGDAAIDLVIGAFEDVVGPGGAGPLRHRIEHCSFATDGQLDRMAKLGLSPSFLMNHVYYWGRAFADHIVGPAKAARLDPMASALSRGLIPSLHSDYRVTEIEPLRSVQTAVTRKVADGGAVLGPEERVDVMSALAAVTSGAAWQLHSEHEVGSVKVGCFADLAVLSADPTSVPVDDIASIAVHETLLGGTPND